MTIPGYCSSPNHPGPYPSDYDCVWRLDYPEGSQIRIGHRDDDFDLAPGTDGCNGDFLEIRNGGEPDSPVLWKGCGSNGIPPGGLVSMSNRMWIAFHSGTNADRHAGFALTAR